MINQDSGYEIENTKFQLEFKELFSSGCVSENNLDKLKGQKKFIKHTKLHTKPKFKIPN